MPIELVLAGDDEHQIALDCTIEDAAGLEHAEEMAYLRLGEFPVEDERYDVTVTEMLALPYYQGIDMPSAGLYAYEQGVEVRYDRVPKGEVEVRRSSPVTILGRPPRRPRRGPRRRRHAARDPPRARARRPWASAT